MTLQVRKGEFVRVHPTKPGTYSCSPKNVVSPVSWTWRPADGRDVRAQRRTAAPLTRRAGSRDGYDSVVRSVLTSSCAARISVS